MRISAKVDYALRALIELARRPGTTRVDELAQAQQIPAKFLGTVMTELRHHNFVSSQNGTQGGYRIRNAETLTVGAVIRAIAGPLMTVRGEPLEEVTYLGSAAPLGPLWNAVRAAVGTMLESVTIADLARDVTLDRRHDRAAILVAGGAVNSTTSADPT